MHSQMGGCWKIVTSDNYTVARKEVLNKKLDLNIPKSKEAAIMLNELEFVNESTTSQLEGELIDVNDNKLLCNSIFKSGRSQDSM